jgi:hypothetical protein
MKTKLSVAALATVIGIGALAAAGAASARIVCNAEGDCWHVDNRVTYPHVVLRSHPDDWYFHQHWDSDREHHWRDYHEGRGYYEHGVWVPR